VVGIGALCFLQCFDTVGWVVAKTSGHKNTSSTYPKRFSSRQNQLTQVYTERKTAVKETRDAFSALTLLVGCQVEHTVCKNWMMRCWQGYLSGAMCKQFAYGPDDTTITPSSLASLKSRLVSPFWCQLTHVVLEKRPLNVCSSSSSLSVCLSVCTWGRGLAYSRPQRKGRQEAQCTCPGIEVGNELVCAVCARRAGVLG